MLGIIPISTLNINEYKSNINQNIKNELINLDSTDFLTKLKNDNVQKLNSNQYVGFRLNDINNSTRFIIVTNQKIFRKDAGKVSICFEVAHESGSLYHALSHFIYNHLNVSKIESRPIENRNWEYRFFLDFDGNLSDSAVKNALRGLREETYNLKILGNY